jgi:hypothetical protein
VKKQRAPALPDSATFQQLWDALGSKLIESTQGNLLYTQGVSGSSLLPPTILYGRWMLKRSEAVHRLIRLTVDYSLELARYWKETFGTVVRMMNQAVNDFGWNG